jgi:ADP-ribose pyrophosphatase
VLAPDEPPEACAARELREEAGLAAADIRRLGVILTTPGFCDERIHLFLAQGLTEVGHSREADEDITEMRRLPLADALAMVRNGEIEDAKTVAGLHLAASALAAA